MAIGLARCQHFHAHRHPLFVDVAVAAAGGGHRRLPALIPSYSFENHPFLGRVYARDESPVVPATSAVYVAVVVILSLFCGGWVERAQENE